MNKTGIQANADTGVPNVTVNCCKRLESSTRRNQRQGIYNFSNVTPGTYSLKFIPNNGAAVHAPNQGATRTRQRPELGGVTSTFTLASGPERHDPRRGLAANRSVGDQDGQQPTPAIGSNVTFTVTVNNASGYSPATGVRCE